MNMKILILFTALLGDCTLGFQFMKNWKMPVHDPYDEAVKAKFGDKSELKRVHELALGN